MVIKQALRPSADVDELLETAARLDGEHVSMDVAIGGDGPGRVARIALPAAPVMAGAAFKAGA